MSVKTRVTVPWGSSAIRLTPALLELMMASMTDPRDQPDCRPVRPFIRHDSCEGHHIREVLHLAVHLAISSRVSAPLRASM